MNACEQVLYSCSTDKQLLETAPELAKYLPEPRQKENTAIVAVETLVYYWKRLRTSMRKLFK
jgi:hypothetical protein